MILHPRAPGGRCPVLPRTDTGKVRLPARHDWMTVDEADMWLHDLLDALHDDDDTVHRPGAATREGAARPMTLGADDPHPPAGSNHAEVSGGGR